MKNTKDISILVTDDSAFMRQYLIGHLHEGGFEKIYEAENGKQAFEKYEQQKPDIVLLDLIMPIDDGMNALQKLVAKKAKVIVVSAMGQKPIIEKVMSLGAKGFFIKPFFTNQELVKTIEAALTEEDS